MTGTQAVYALGGAFLCVVFVWFLGKLVLRLAGRKVVKVYTVVQPWYPPPIAAQPPGLFYPPAAHPPADAANFAAPHEPTSADAGELTEDEQFDDIVRNFYSR